MKNYRLVLLICLLTFCGITSAQEMTKEERKAQKKAQKNAEPTKGTTYFSIIPILSSNPSFGFMYGVAAATSKYNGDPMDTRISTMQTGVTFTSMNQTLITNKATVYGNHNNFKLDTDWRYLESSQGTFGLGSGPQSRKLASNGFEIEEGIFSAPVSDKDLLEFNWIRLYQTYSKQIKPGFYLGLGYHLDLLRKVKDNLLDLDEDPQVITPYYAYNEKYGFDQNKSNLSGISFNVMYDTRDNLNAPYKGRYAQLTFRINPEFLGSTHNSTSLWAEYRDYLDLTKNHRNIFALWFYASIQTSGAHPYLNLPAINYDQFSASGRGYTQGRIRGQALMYSEIEYRKKLFGNKHNPDFFGINLFLNFTTASNKDADISLFDFIDPAYGIGMRFELNPKSRTAIDVDFAWGKYGSKGMYLYFNEFF